MNKENKVNVEVKKSSENEVIYVYNGNENNDLIKFVLNMNGINDLNIIKKEYSKLKDKNNKEFKFNNIKKRVYRKLFIDKNYFKNKEFNINEKREILKNELKLINLNYDEIVKNSLSLLNNVNSRKGFNSSNFLDIKNF